MIFLFVSGCISFEPLENKAFMDSYNLLNGTYLRNTSSMDADAVVGNVTEMVLQLEHLKSTGYNSTYEERIYSELLPKLRLWEIAPKSRTEQHERIRKKVGEFMNMTRGSYFSVNWDAVEGVANETRKETITLKRRGYATNEEDLLIEIMERRAMMGKRIYGSLLSGFRCERAAEYEAQLNESLDAILKELEWMVSMDNQSKNYLGEEYGYDWYEDVNPLGLHEMMHSLQRDYIHFVEEGGGDGANWIRSAIYPYPNFSCTEEYEPKVISLELSMDNDFACHVGNLSYTVTVMENSTGPMMFNRSYPVGKMAPTMRFAKTFSLTGDMADLPCRKYYVKIAAFDDSTGEKLQEMGAELPGYPDEPFEVEFRSVQTKCDEGAAGGSVEGFEVLITNHLPFETSEMLMSGRVVGDGRGILPRLWSFGKLKANSQMYANMGHSSQPLTKGSHIAEINIQSVDGKLNITKTLNFTIC